MPTLLLLALVPIALLASSSAANPVGPPSASPLPAQEIVKKMMQRNLERAEALRGFQGTRFYKVRYIGLLGNREAEMVANVTYRAPNSKEFSIISQSGSKLLIDRVLKKLLESEQEAVDKENRAHTALSTDNYNFSLVGYEPKQGGACYVLAVEPKSDYKFLYRGKIWVDANDFAVTRIEAEPARNPSFWTKKNEIQHTYEKVDDFWLPQHNQSISAIRLGGRAILTIDYDNYRVTEASVPSSVHSHARVPAAAIIY